MTWSGWETLPEVWQALSDVQEWSRGPPGCPGVVGKPYRMSRRPSQMFVSVQKSLPDDR